MNDERLLTLLNEIRDNQQQQLACISHQGFKIYAVAGKIVW